MVGQGLAMYIWVESRRRSQVHRCNMTCFWCFPTVENALQCTYGNSRWRFSFYHPSNLWAMHALQSWSRARSPKAAVNARQQRRASRSFPFGSLIIGANHLSSTAFSFCCPSRTYSYELSVRVLLRKSIQFLAVITPFGLQIRQYLEFLLLYSSNAFSLVDKCKFNGYQRVHDLLVPWSVVWFSTPQTSPSHWICRHSSTPDGAGLSTYHTFTWRKHARRCSYCHTVKVPALG